MPACDGLCSRRRDRKAAITNAALSISQNLSLGQCVPDLVKACSDPETQRWLFMLPTPYTASDGREFLAQAGRVDRQRILVLRTVSNYDRQPRGMSAADSLAAQRTSQFGAYLPSLEDAYAVGNVVVNELLSQWSKYAGATIGADHPTPSKP